jgi:uncharacterized protein (UPF0548 family)
VTTAPHPPVHCTAPIPPATVRELHALAERPLNFEPGELGSPTRAWHHDRRRQGLPGEAPGPPTADGSFAAARRILDRYEFADHRLVRAAFYRHAPMEGRDMLLVGRFLGLRFPMGVRVGGVREGPDELDGAPVHRYAWHYSTLAGHLEQGRMDYELLKWTDTGRVELRIDARSRLSDIRNPVVWIGARLFARREQLTFYERALQRTYTLVERTCRG